MHAHCCRTEAWSVQQRPSSHRAPLGTPPQPKVCATGHTPLRQDGLCALPVNPLTYPQAPRSSLRPPGAQRPSIDPGAYSLPCVVQQAAGEAQRLRKGQPVAAAAAASTPPLLVSRAWCRAWCRRAAALQAGCRGGVSRLVRAPPGALLLLGLRPTLELQAPQIIHGGALHRHLRSGALPRP
jgi:hypothetical protein